MKNIAIKALIVLILTLTQSCAFYGGGTIGTGLPLGKGSNSATNVSYVDFTVSVYDINYNPVSSAQVFLSTSRLEENAITNNDGYSELNIIADSKETISVRVVANGKKYINSFKLATTDVNSGSVNLILAPNNQLKIEDLELF